MEGPRLIHALRLRNFLSFGSEGAEVPLEPLNVLIGPNASGKSNFIEAIALLRATTRDLGRMIRGQGGARSWIWSGAAEDAVAEVGATVGGPSGGPPWDYSLQFRAARGGATEVVAETIESGGEVIRRSDVEPPCRSLLAEPDGDGRPAILRGLAERLDSIRIYREWAFGPKGATRRPQPQDTPGEFLEEDASNLVHVLSRLQARAALAPLLKKIQRVYEGAGVGHDGVSLRTNGAKGTAHFLVWEDGERAIPAPRLSGGTLRYLALLAILCHPEPPPLVCIEEPEVGLHPDLMPEVARLLLDASERTQLIVTTHSPGLVTALAEVVEAVLICERDRSGTHLTRLDPVRLDRWLERYTLGDLWSSGEIGGTRW